MDFARFFKGTLCGLVGPPSPRWRLVMKSWNGVARQVVFQESRHIVWSIAVLVLLIAV